MEFRDNTEHLSCRDIWSLKRNARALVQSSHRDRFLFAALFAPRMFAVRPGQKSPTALHDESAADGDKDKDDSINYTTVDWREFMCNTWHLEPTLRSAVLRRARTHTPMFVLLSL